MKPSNLFAAGRLIQKVLRYIGLFILVIIVIWLFKADIFSVYYIPSGSMMPPLQPGDYVWVAQFPYNLRTPQFYPLTGIPFPAYSTNGIGKVRRGDVMVFDLPLFPAQLPSRLKENYIKRCVGLPGDSMAIYKNHYYLKKAGGWTSGHKLWQAGAIMATISAKGERLELTDSTKAFWQPILRRDGNRILEDSAGQILVNGTKRKWYRVGQNYYFVEGDNRDHSADSRYWGLVPKTNLIGRADIVLWPWPLRWF